MYSRPEIFKKLVLHSSNHSVIQVLQLLLCINSSKIDKYVEKDEALKGDIVELLMEQLKSTNVDSVLNVCSLLGYVIDNYYLIADSKRMLEGILAGEFSEFLFRSSLKGDGFLLEAIAGLIVTILRYYSYSSFNTEHKESQ